MATVGVKGLTCHRLNVDAAFLPAWCYASTRQFAVEWCLSVCPSIRHDPILYQNGL